LDLQKKLGFTQLVVLEAARLVWNLVCRLASKLVCGVSDAWHGGFKFGGLAVSDVTGGRLAEIVSLSGHASGTVRQCQPVAG
jgi:hypothetical protein